ncbi:MAG: protein kinase [Pyrinomonadaceae bacterium]|nr:protein kinase [Pyrinomonadaceae bacterium]
MKFCSVCHACYDDSIAVCNVEGHPALAHARDGNCLSIEGYRFDSRFRSGSPVEIYKATHLASDKQVLIQFNESDDSIEVLEEELREVSEATHPNLARVFEFGKVSKREFYTVLENPSGLSLRDCLDGASTLPEKKAIRVVRQISETLDALHLGGLVHRAVNPDNVFINDAESNDISAKLHGYDLAGAGQQKLISGSAGVDAKPELLRYFSPEQYREDAVDFRSDIYSLATVFYEMLLGHPTVDLINGGDISDYIFDESDVSALHPDLRALVAHTLRESLQRQPHLRPKTTNNLVRQLRHLEQIANRSANGPSIQAEDGSIKAESTRPVIEFAESGERAVKEEIAEGEAATIEPTPAYKYSLNDAKAIDDDPEATFDFNDVEEITDYIQTVNVNFDQSKSSSSDSPGEIDPAQGFSEELGSKSSRGNSYLKAIPLPAFPQIGRAPMYLAGILLSAILGGLFTAGFLNQDRQAVPQNVVRTDEPGDSRDINPVRMVDPDSTADNRGSDDPKSYIDTKLEDRANVFASRINGSRTTARKVSERRIAKKRSVKRRNKRKPRSRKNRKKSSRIKATDGKTRPRVVSNVVIYY